MRTASGRRWRPKFDERRASPPTSALADRSANLIEQGSETLRLGASGLEQSPAFDAKGPLSDFQAADIRRRQRVGHERLKVTWERRSRFANVEGDEERGGIDVEGLVCRA
jgi:hypothetical protein